MSAAVKVSVIIPYFQRESGILRRALQSILSQCVDANVEVIVIDDGSPAAVQDEVAGLIFADPFNLKIIAQENSGVGAARNSGLKTIDGSTKYIAFLDSDDSWDEGHLQQAINALEDGNDFYFCDNKREDSDKSHFAGTSSIQPFISENKIIALTKNEIFSLILQDFPCLIPTVVYRRSCAPDLLFDPRLKNAGEDAIFFMQLLGNMKNICFSPKIMVSLGAGVNIYFGSLEWDSPKNLQRNIDRLQSHVFIKKNIALSREQSALNDSLIGFLRKNIVFHSLRLLIKNKGKWPAEMSSLARQDSTFFMWFSAYLFPVIVGKAIGVYKPS